MFWIRGDRNLHEWHATTAGLWIHKYGAMEDLEAGAAMQMMDLPVDDGT